MTTPQRAPARETRRFAGAVLCAACACSVGLALAEPDPHAAETKTQVTVQQIRPGLHVLLSPGGNVAVWSGPDGTVLVDSMPAAAGPALAEAVARVAAGPVRFVVNTSWHPEHTGGNEQAAGSGAVIVAHDNVRRRMSVAQFIEAYALRVPPAPRRALPVVTFADQVALSLNGDRLTAEHVDDAHTDGDVVLWWEAGNVVAVGDVFDDDSYPFVDLSSGGSLAGLVAALEGVLSRADAGTVVIPGRGPVSNRAELVAYRDMVVAVGRKVRALVEQGSSLDQVLAARPTAEFDERYGKGAVTPERFVRILYQDLADRR